MESAIVGLPYVGKTTLFNLLTGGHAATGGFAGAEGAVNVGVAKVPDDRVDRLAALFKPKKTTHAEVRYADVGLARSAHGTPQGSGKADGAGAQRLGELRNADALVHVVRAFRDPSVPHVEGDVDPARDAAALELELLVADLAVVERRVERIAPELRIARETYSLLGLVSFFTVGPDEVRAWTIPAGTTAQSAAGVIHTDLARGFIRAEVIRWDELLALGGLAEAKSKGKLRVESKEHVMLDGEVMNVLFNV